MIELNITKKELISKGMSSDKKYYVETADQKRLLLRVADISEYDRNMILSEDKEIFIIDWHTVDFENYGDPWIELARYSDNPYFTSGQINGYFMGAPQKEFWALFAYYLATSAITSIVWAKYFAPERLSSIIQLNRDVLVWFDNMKNPVPSWYLKGESL